MMKASYLGARGIRSGTTSPPLAEIPPIYHDPETSVRSYQEGIEECELAEEMGFEWVSSQSTTTPAGSPPARRQSWRRLWRNGARKPRSLCWATC